MVAYEANRERRNRQPPLKRAGRSPCRPIYRRPRAVSPGPAPEGIGLDRPKTVADHGERIYALINASTRVLSMRHGLMPGEGLSAGILA
jgi:hypothetical protein